VSPAGVRAATAAGPPAASVAAATDSEAMLITSR
jgi:hypothetical protein